MPAGAPEGVNATSARAGRDEEMGSAGLEAVEEKAMVERRVSCVAWTAEGSFS